MMKKHLRYFALIFVVIYMSVIVIGCQSIKTTTETEKKETNVSEEVPEGLNLVGYPIVNEPVTFDVIYQRHASTAPFEDLIVFKEMEKLTNVKINWMYVPPESYVERRNLAFATGDLPDAFMKANMSAIEIMKYSSSGAMVPLNPYLEKYAPNLNKYLKANSNIKKGVTMLDGNIYGFPYILESSAIRVQARMFFDVNLMNNVGATMPKTIDDFLNYLRLIRDNDANGNGDPNDEVPLASSSLSHIAQMTAGSFGLNMNGLMSPYFDMPEGSNDFRFIPMSDDYREHIKFLRTLYSEGLIDQEIFTMTSTKTLAQVTEKRVGAIVWWSASFIPAGKDDDYIHLERQLIGPKGHHAFTGVIGAVHSPATFIITSKCKTPEILVRWVDYFYSEEGIALYLLGVKGVTYEEDANGKPYFKDIIMKNPDGLSFQQAYGLYMPQAGGGNPTILTEKHYISGEGLPKSRAASDSMKDDVLDFSKVWESFIYSPTEAEVLSSLQTDIASYVNESLNKFVSGVIDINNDSDWEAYKKEFDKIGLQDYIKMFRIGYERYMEK